MVFVNEIAEIVHNVVDQYGGASNKNIGDSFLFVWKFPPESCLDSPETQTYTVEKTVRTSAITELAVLAFVNVQAKIAKSARLEKYRYNNNLISRVGSSDTEFRVKMGFGMHIGWAVECALGSEFKIDASYLSPHVSVTCRLENLTKMYGLSFLMSEDVVEMLRQPVQGFLRMVDRVRIKGLSHGIAVFTLDVNPAALPVELNEDKEANGLERKKKRLIERQKKEKVRRDYISGKTSERELLSQQKDLIQMRLIFTEGFYQEWDYGMEFYLAGSFAEAKAVFEKTQKMLLPGYEDLASKKLLAFIEESGLEPPADWDKGKDLIEEF